MEAKVGDALRRVARGASLQAAARDSEAPYASLNKAWKAMGGDVGSPTWLAFAASLPPLAPTTQPTREPAVDESPLGPRLKRLATRHGDGVPYGKHGPWGLYREGVKEMTSKIAEGKVSAGEAAEQLADEGVSIAARVLARKAKETPGESPVKPGPGTRLSPTTERALHKDIKFMRDHDVIVTKPMIKAMADARIKDTPEAEAFEDGAVGDAWYYGFLDRYDMHGDDTKPLESDRDLWLTSKDRPPAQPNPFTFRLPLLTSRRLPSPLCRMPKSSMRSGPRLLYATRWQCKIRTLIQTSRTTR